MRAGDTNRCFAKQLLCLYPFPHFSHLSSPLARLPSALDRCAPSLARRFLALEKPDPLSANDGPSTTALSPSAPGPSRIATPSEPCRAVVE